MPASTTSSRVPKASKDDFWTHTQDSRPQDSRLREGGCNMPRLTCVHSLGGSIPRNHSVPALQVACSTVRPHRVHSIGQSCKSVLDKLHGICVTYLNQVLFCKQV
eukprot:1911796-Amphidinium_carterae.1